MQVVNTTLFHVSCVKKLSWAFNGFGFLVFPGDPANGLAIEHGDADAGTAGCYHDGGIGGQLVRYVCCNFF